MITQLFLLLFGCAVALVIVGLRGWLEATYTKKMWSIFFWLGVTLLGVGIFLLTTE